ncbi:MAG TPA: efflux RND transporter periplasmic adaptor subunit [Woeseiaceae bacterium]|nr:efflux RND transporter periplasmic adaptor subunit [Woeseiaceae bacterium]
MKSYHLKFLLMFLSALATATGCRGEAATESMPPPPKVSVAAVVGKDVRPWDEYTGHIEAVETVELRPRVSGYIERVNYEEGGEVEKGDVLFVIDQRTYLAELARVEAELARAHTQAKFARSEVARATKLADARALSAEELDQRKSTLAQAEANIRAVQAAVDVAKLNLEFTKVRAPISGRAGRAAVTPGNLVSTEPNATILTTIVSQDPVYVYFEGYEGDDLRREALSRDMHIPVRVSLASDDGYPYKGALNFVDNQVNPDTGTIRARAILPNPDRIFTPGQFARVQLAGPATVHALLIDNRAVLTDQDRKYVYAIDEDGNAQRRDVQLGRMVDGLRVVESGLEVDDKVIVHGVQKVFMPGMPVDAELIAMGDPPPGPQTTAASF